MDFAPCPKCGAFNAPDAATCAKCKSPLDAEPDAGPAIALKPLPPAPGPAPEPAAPPPASASPSPPPPRTPPGAFTPAHAGIAQRPPRPPMPAARPAGRFSRGRMIALAGALIAVAVMVKLAAFPSTRLLVGDGVEASTPVWSPTGKHLAFLLTDSRGGHLGVYDFASKSHRVAGDLTGGGADPFSWSLDGKRIAYAGPGAQGDWTGAIYVYDLAAGTSKALASGSSPHFRADGSLVAVCGPERARFGDDSDEGSAILDGSSDYQDRFCRIDADSGTVTRLGLAADYGMALSPLVDRVVFERYPETIAEGAEGAGGDAEFQRMADAIVAGKASNVVEGNRDLNRELEAKAARDKRKAARGAGRVAAIAEVFSADLNGAPPVRIFAAGEAAYPSWTEAGDRILFARNGASGVELWMARDDGSDRQPVLSGVKIADPAAVRLSADGKLVFFVSPVEGDPGMAKLMTGEEPADLYVAPVGGGPAKRLSNKHPFKHRFAVSPDAKRIAYEVLTDTKMLAGTAKSEIWLMSR